MDRQTNGQWTDRRTDKLTDRRHTDERTEWRTWRTWHPFVRQIKAQENMELELELELQRRRRRRPQMGPAWLGMVGHGLGEGMTWGKWFRYVWMAFWLPAVALKVASVICVAFFGVLRLLFYFFVFVFWLFFTSLALIMAKSCHIAALWRLSYSYYCCCCCDCLAAVCAAWQMQSGLSSALWRRLIKNAEDAARGNTCRVAATSSVSRTNKLVSDSRCR